MSWAVRRCGTPRGPLEQLERELRSSRAQSLALDAVDDELARLTQARWAATQDLWAAQTRKTLAEHRARWMPGRRRALRHAVDAVDAAHRRVEQLEEREDQLRQLVVTRPIRHEPPGTESVYREPLARRVTRDLGREL
jgi:Xaa-Pro aminopeptidase